VTRFFGYALAPVEKNRNFLGLDNVGKMLELHGNVYTGLEGQALQKNWIARLELFAVP
jgi:hypothetical protein